MIRKTDGIIGCHDISEGGLGLALAELCIFNKIGIKINIPKNFTQTHEKWIFVTIKMLKTFASGQKRQIFLYFDQKWPKIGHFGPQMVKNQGLSNCIA